MDKKCGRCFFKRASSIKIRKPATKPSNILSFSVYQRSPIGIDRIHILGRNISKHRKSNEFFAHFLRSHFGRTHQRSHLFHHSDFDRHRYHSTHHPLDPTCSHLPHPLMDTPAPHIRRHQFIFQIKRESSSRRGIVCRVNLNLCCVSSIFKQFFRC